MMRILVVDDVPVVRMVIARLLKRAGHTVIEANDGREAVRVFEGAAVDVLVTDVWMPGTGGLDLIRSAVRRLPGLAIVAMSGGTPQATMTNSLAEAEAAGACVVVMKPIDKDELLAAVVEAVRRTRKEQP